MSVIWLAVDMATLHSFKFKMYTHQKKPIFLFTRKLDRCAFEHIVITLLHLKYLQIRKRFFYFQIKTVLCKTRNVFVYWAFYSVIKPGMCIFYLFKYREIWMRKKYECVWLLNQHIVCLYYSYFVVYNYSSWNHLFKVCSFVKCFIPRENVAIPLFVDECYFVRFGLQTRLSDRSCYSVFDWMNVIG